MYKCTLKLSWDAKVVRVWQVEPMFVTPRDAKDSVSLDAILGGLEKLVTDLLEKHMGPEDESLWDRTARLLTNAGIDMPEVKCTQTAEGQLCDSISYPQQLTAFIGRFVASAIASLPEEKSRTFCPDSSFRTREAARDALGQTILQSALLSLLEDDDIVPDKKEETKDVRMIVKRDTKGEDIKPPPIPIGMYHYTAYTRLFFDILKPGDSWIEKPMERLASAVEATTLRGVPIETKYEFTFDDDLGLFGPSHFSFSAPITDILSGRPRMHIEPLEIRRTSPNVRNSTLR